MIIIKPKNRRITPEEIQKVKEIPIIDFLSKIDIHPKKIRGNEYWFLSPLRDEKTASFCVNIQKNVWHDFAEGSGGDIIDLAKLMIHTKDFKEAIGYIEVMMSLDDGQFQRRDSKPILPSESHPVQIKKIKKLENNALVDYLQNRCIPLDITQQFCKEIYYSIGDKKYFGIAFPNSSLAGGYVVRNKYAKICLGENDITFLPSSSTNNVLFIYEGFFDMLSHQELLRMEGYTGNFPYEHSIVLNSVNNLDSSIGTVANYGKVCLFLDNDPAGQKATEKYKKSCADFGCICEDHSDLYAPYKDLNDFLISKKINNHNEKQKLKT